MASTAPTADDSRSDAAARPERTVKTIRGQHHKFPLLPIKEDEAVFFTAGAITFGVEGRAFGKEMTVVERGGSLHVLNADRSVEYLRFDCFEKGPHYHYILHEAGHNILWGFDSDINGPIIPWAVNAIRTRLPVLLRKVGADSVAAAVEAQGGIDEAVLTEVEAALHNAYDRTFPGTDMLADSAAWYRRWKTMVPHFNTVDGDDY